MTKKKLGRPKKIRLYWLDKFKELAFDKPKRDPAQILKDFYKWSKQEEDKLNRRFRK